MNSLAANSNKFLKISLSKTILFFAIVCCIFSCIKERPQPTILSPINVKSVNKIYVINEGNFGSSISSSVLLYDPITRNVNPNYFYQINKEYIGDVCQSMTFKNSKIYIVVNNSGKIIVCDTTLKKLSEIKNFISPRYMVFVNENHAYVSDYASNKIAVVNTLNNSIERYINLNGWTEEMFYQNNKMYISNYKSKYLYVANTLTHSLADSIEIGYGANSMVQDKNNKLWVLCSGFDYNGINSSLVRLHSINLETNKIENTIALGAVNEPASKLKINGNKDKLFFLKKDIYSMAITQNTATKVYNADNKNIYALGINKQNDDVYFSDAIDFNQNSDVYHLDKNFELLNKFKSGIITSEFYFIK
jgi:DNA-binding beta-propeller fold protein YncE